MFDKIKAIFKKEETFPCIVFDGQKMSYPHLSKKQIDEINNNPKYKDWKVILKEKQE